MLPIQLPHRRICLARRLRRWFIVPGKTVNRSPIESQSRDCVALGLHGLVPGGTIGGCVSLTLNVVPVRFREFRLPINPAIECVTVGRRCAGRWNLVPSIAAARSRFRNRGLGIRADPIGNGGPFVGG